jgi:hypothetical protein
MTHPHAIDLRNVTCSPFGAGGGHFPARRRCRVCVSGQAEEARGAATGARQLEACGVRTFDSLVCHWIGLLQFQRRYTVYGAGDNN